MGFLTDKLPSYQPVFKVDSIFEGVDGRALPWEEEDFILAVDWGEEWEHSKAWQRSPSAEESS